MLNTPTGLGEGLKLSPWASLANAAIFKELYSGRSLSGPRGRGLGLDSCLACLPVVPILPEPDFTSTTIFNLFSSWWLVPPLVVRGVAPFHVRNNALSDFRLQPLILNFFHWSEQSPNEPFRLGLAI